VLPAAHRLRTAADFTAVTRRGRRVRCGSVVVYLLAGPAQGAHSAGTRQAGLVVGKAVGGSVVRHQVSRRLRAQLSDRLDRIPGGAKLVVRALPETATATSAVLGRDLGRALDKLTSPISSGGDGSSSDGSSSDGPRTTPQSDSGSGPSGSGR
jgi:ribonuclease P protein component